MASATDPITLNTSLEQVSLNGKAYKSSYDATAKTITLTTPVGRQVVTTLDVSGRVVQSSRLGVLPVSVHYDVKGRPDSVSQGTRSYTYDSFGRVQTITDPLHASTLAYDAANRLKSVLLPDSSSLFASYDTGSNLTSLTPPGKSAHGFTYQAGDLESDYTPPAVDGSGTGHVHTDYDLDRQVSLVAADGIPPPPSPPTIRPREGSPPWLSAAGRTPSGTIPPAGGSPRSRPPTGSP